jgi:hypothetical protein
MAAESAPGQPDPARARSGRVLIVMRQRPNKVGVGRKHNEERSMNSIVYLVGLVVIVIAILSFIGLR